MLLLTDQYPQPEDLVTDTSPALIAAAIETACDHRWAVWLSDTGTWWAARTAGLTAAQATPGCVPFLRADTPDELTARIGQQDQADPSRPQPTQPANPTQSGPATPVPATTRIS
jgi:hypothetical protein